MHRVGIVGTGFIATQKHLPAWRKIRDIAQVVALCDTDAERGKKTAQEFGVPKAYGDMQRMLEVERLDVVDICTPPKTHADVALSALKAGAHVFLEKPMALTTEECDRIIAAGNAASKKICVAHSDLFYPAYRKARQLVAQDEIGEFRGMRIFFSTPVDYVTSRPDHWANRLPGGVIGETGPHVVYLTLAFINPIVDVQVRAHKLLHDFPWSPFEDYRLDLVGKNAVSSVTLAYGTKHWIAHVDLWGSDGLLRLDLESQTLVRYTRPALKPATIGLSSMKEALQIMKGTISTSARVLSGRYQNPHDYLLRGFLNSLQNGQPPPSTAEEGREAVRVMNLIVEKIQPASS